MFMLVGIQLVSCKVQSQTVLVTTLGQPVPSVLSAEALGAAVPTALVSGASTIMASTPLVFFFHALFLLAAISMNVGTSTPTASVNLAVFFPAVFLAVW